MALILCPTNQLSHVLGVYTVKDVEEILAVRQSSLREPIRQVGHQPGVLLELLQYAADRKFLIFRNLYPLDLCKREQPLLAGENLPEPVLVDHRLRSEIQLHCERVLWN